MAHIGGPHTLDAPYSPYPDQSLVGTVTNVSQRLQLPVASEVYRIAVTQPTWIRLGDETVVAAFENGSVLVPIGDWLIRWSRLTPGNWLAFVRDSAPNGRISIVPLCASSLHQH